MSKALTVLEVLLPFAMALVGSIILAWFISSLGAPTWAAWGFGIVFALLKENRIIYRQETDRKELRTYARALTAFLSRQKQ